MKSKQPMTTRYKVGTFCLDAAAEVLFWGIRPFEAKAFAQPFTPERI
ncbi:MAG: hypothetical protein ACKVP3_24580 [Hyphomicrobiaceae bacterium]